MKKVMLVGAADQLLVNELKSTINNEEDWVADIATAVETAIEKLYQQNFDVVVLTPGLSSEQENKLRKIFLFQHPEGSIINSAGSDVEELFAAIKNEFKNKRRASFSFVDDVLKNAGIPISYN